MYHPNERWSYPRRLKGPQAPRGDMVPSQDTEHPGNEMALTVKQEAFCLAYLETGNASEAYRRAYSAEKMKQEVIAVKACELLKTGNVAVRVAELQNAAVKRNEITVDDLIRELEEARTAALTCETPQSSASVAATMGKAKLLGFLTDKTELTGANGGPLEFKRIERIVVDPK